MKDLAKKISLKPFDDMFETDASREDIHREKIQEIPLSELHPFSNHPFYVKDDEAMAETAESVEKYGVLVPAIVRPRTNGGYELISGHRRKRASELAGKETMPVIVRTLDDDEAIIIMVDSNLQRESILPSEKAFSYKMKLEAMKRQGQRSDLTCSQVGNKLKGKKSSEILAEQTGESKNQIFRYIRLTELIVSLLCMVDEKKLSLNPAVELSYLQKSEQENVLSALETLNVIPTLSQALQLKKYSKEDKLTIDLIEVILSEEKPEVKKLVFTNDKLKKYFPSSYSSQQMENTIINLLEQWKETQLN